MRSNEAAWMDKYQRWQIKVQKDGERRTFYSSVPGSKGKIECERKADKWIERNIQNDKIRVDVAFKEFLENVLTTTSTSNHYMHNSIWKTWLSPAVRTKKLTKITQMDWQKCINNAYKAGRAKKTLMNIRGTITSFYRFCMQSGYEMVQPDMLKIPKDAYVKEKKILQPEQIRFLFSDEAYTEASSFYIHAFRFLVITGLRRGELCGLKKEDIKKNGLVYIKRAINRHFETTETKTLNSQRHFKLTKFAQNVLQEQAEMLKGYRVISPYVFPGRDGEVMHPKALENAWNRYKATVDIDCTLHEMRHTFVSLMQVDVPERLLKKVVGHSKTMDTMGVYAHGVDGDDERACDYISSVQERVLIGESGLQGK